MTCRRKLTIAAVVVMVAAAGIGIALATTSSSPKVSVKAPKVKPFMPPATINTTCTTDDTEALGAWLLSVPNGTAGHDSVAKLKKGACYTVSGTVWWRGPENIVLDGNGATIRQGAIAPTTPWYIAGRQDNPAVVPYCGRTEYRDSLYSAKTGVPLLLAVDGGCSITIEDLTIIGMHPTAAGDPEPHSFYQPASLISLYGAQRVLINHVTERGPYGDFVTCDGFSQAPGGGGSYPSTDVTVKNSSFTGAGRAGISETNGCERILVTGNTFSGGGFDMFDIEQDANYPAYSEEDINITRNMIVGVGGGSGYAFLIAAQTGSELQRVAFTDNVLTEGAQVRINIAPHAFGGSINNSVIIEGNKSTASSSWPHRSPVNVLNMVNVLVANNVDPPPSYGGKGYPFASFSKGATGTLACGDKTPTGTALDAPCPPALPTITPPMLPVLPS